MSTQLNLFESGISGDKTTEPVNVASVPQRSPFRYPGGKTWLIPLVRKWLKQDGKVNCLVEPFAGGGIVSLTAAFEDLAQTIKMAELDEDVAAVWEVILNGKNQWLADKIKSFDLTPENVKIEFEKPSKQIQDIAFCTILKNRIYHGGIITKGSGMIKNGENGKGIKSRWYPKTLSDRITAINYIKNKIEFRTGDAFQLIEENKNDTENYFFIDPPYTIAGKRLYTFFEVDHEKLFFLVSQIKGKFMLTYDDTDEVRNWATKYDLEFRTIPMKTTHHIKKNELIICDSFSWWNEQQNL
jgi:DNA adenine methylase